MSEEDEDGHAPRPGYVAGLDGPEPIGKMRRPRCPAAIVAYTWDGTFYLDAVPLGDDVNEAAAYLRNAGGFLRLHARAVQAHPRVAALLKAWRLR